MRRSWRELRDRKVVQWSLGYLAAAWVLYQVLSQVAENFAWPPAIMRAATVLLAVGLPVAAVLAWYHGEKGRQRVGLAEVVLLGTCGLVGAVSVRAVTDGTAREAPPAEASPAVLLNSIAVLPLTNRGEADQEYFADGLTEELMGALSRVPGLRVAARTSSFAFKDRRVGMDSVAAALRVRHLLDGSVQRRGDSVRVSVALIDSRNHYELWNASYRRPVADIFALQQEIARAVVEALPLDPVLLAGDLSFQPHTAELPAYDLFLLGRQAWNRRTGADLLRALDLFEQAVRLDPSYAPAWAALAETYIVLPGYAPVSARTAEHRLREAAARALTLDSTLVRVHAVLGYSTAWHAWDFPTAIARMQRALEIDPEYAPALHWQGELLAHVGRFSEARANFELALELDPLAPVIAADFGQALQLAGEHEEAVARLERLLATEPGYLIGEYWLFYPALLTGRYGRAEAVARSLAPKIGLDADGLALAVRALTGEASREDALGALDAQPRAVPGVGLTILAALYGRLGALDQGFAILEAGSDQHFQGNVFLVTHPVFEPFRSDPRYPPLADLVRVR